jgi:hypothetical protein
MHRTSSVVHIPASTDVLLLVEIFTNPRHFGGGGSITVSLSLRRVVNAQLATNTGH